MSHRGKSNRGTPVLVGTTQGSTDSKVYTLAPDRKPWLLPERLVTSLSGETTPHNKYPLFIAIKLHGLDPSAKNFRAEEDFYLDAFLKHRRYNGNSKRDKASLMQAWNALFAMSKTWDAKLGFENLTRHALSSKHVSQPVLNINALVDS